MALHADLPLVSTIAVGFSVAFVCGLVAARLRLSPIVGYLIAGILIGPHTPGFVADLHIAEQLSEVGILLLMFGVGLHFSVRDLWAVRKIALPGAIVQITAATLMSLAVCHFWDWSFVNGLMLGLALSVASTVVLLRALEQHRLLQTTNGNIAVGWLIVEDIFVVLALVLIPALAVHADGGTDAMAGGFPWAELALAIAKVSLFVGLMLVVGKRALPWLLMVVARTGSRELFTLSVFAVAMGIAFAAAELFDVSFALGAFFAGMMIKESDHSHEAAAKALPLQDAFAVLFFVSVGMLFDSNIVFEQPLRLLAVVGIIMIGKSIAATAIILFFRYPLKTALVVSAGLAQVGEFSFILAGLGVSYNILPTEGRDLILAGALVTITLNPAAFLAIRKIHDFAARNKYLAAWFSVSSDKLSHLEEEKAPVISRTARVILVGHGRVGQYITQQWQSNKAELVVVDGNRERIAKLREAGMHAIAGDAMQAETLIEAGVEQAAAILVAVPNPFEVRHIVELAREISPNIRVLVRAQNDHEMEYFTGEGVSLVVMGPREVGRRMVEHLERDVLAVRVL
jgi:CPA2 family monovalent cation:H+ antiporter-2